VVTSEQVWEALRQVTDPEYPLSIVDLGMVYGVEVDDGNVQIDMTFTAIGCPAIEMILSDVKDAIDELTGVAKLKVDVVWSPPWTKDKITPHGREILQYYGVGV
jgi:phenylacetate-CoA oxygenase PaaJ subunit